MPKNKMPKGKKMKMAGRGRWGNSKPCAGGSKTCMTKREMGCKE
jgi:hypothetical protein